MSVVEFGDWPKRIRFGEGATAQLADAVHESGGSRALVICGRTVAGGEMLVRVKEGLGEACAGVFAEAQSHTPIELIDRAVQAFRDSGADALVTVGGGSAIDTGKAVAIQLAEVGDLKSYTIASLSDGASARPLPGKLVPHVAVPTTAGSASDVMPTAAVRDAASDKKLLFWDEKLVPAAVILDPVMASFTGPTLTAATGMTAMARSVESLYSRHRHPISSGLALHAIRLLRRALPRSIEAPGDLEARGACQMACVMSGMAAINAMVSVVHAVGHVVGGRYRLQHGISHTILLPPAMRELVGTLGQEEALLVAALSDAAGDGPGTSGGRSAAELMAAFVSDLPLPKRLREVGIGEDDLAALAEHASEDYMMANLPRPMSKAELHDLLRQVH